MFDELKPCPFCGTEARLFVGEGVRVLCPKCGAMTKILVDTMDVIGIDYIASNATKDVIKAWNRRADNG